jgi:hypothetical protein
MLGAGGLNIVIPAKAGIYCLWKKLLSSSPFYLTLRCPGCAPKQHRVIICDKRGIMSWGASILLIY